MSILLKHEIENNIRKGMITSNGKQIDLKNVTVGVNSIDVTLGNVLKTYFPLEIITLPNGEKIVNKMKSDIHFIDIKKPNKVFELKIPETGIILTPGILYLGYTNEALGSSYHVPMYEGRSSMARLGIQSHISAGFGDIGFDAQWTLEILVSQPTKIYPNIRIGQVYFSKVNFNEAAKAIKDNNLYQGKYKNQVGAQESKSYLDNK